MDKTAIKNFAIEARKILMKSAESRAGFYGITKDEINSPVQKGTDFEIYKTVAGTDNRIFGRDIQRRKNLVNAINEKGFDQVVEETAYTWFNRIIAIRFMEVNDYLPTRTRVLSSETGGNTPDIISHYLEIELNLSFSDIEKIESLISNNKYDDAFKILFIKQCNELNDILPGLFEKTDDYMELLLDISYTGDGVVRMLVDDVAEDNFNVEKEGQVEIIGWLYQYYNTELKDDTFAKLKKNVKITKERIPAATQLFTPDWIVRYMVENSLGRVWIDHLRADDESVDEKQIAEDFGWKYYLPEAEQEPEVLAELVRMRAERKDLTPQDITCIDPCMGSGHILVYMFNVLLQIYESEGINVREAVFNILEKNIHGLDIDVRAYQLSYFALMMKGRGAAGRRFFRGVETENGSYRPVELNVYAIDESDGIDGRFLSFLRKKILDIDNNAEIHVNTLLNDMKDAKIYGSILNIHKNKLQLLSEATSKIFIEGQLTIDTIGIEDNKNKFRRLIEIAEVMTRKYRVVCTNPPYLSSSGMNEKLINYIRREYKVGKNDMYSAFILKCRDMTIDTYYYAMITMQGWMFTQRFEELRSVLLADSLNNMLHIGYNTFPELNSKIAQGTSFVFNKTTINGYKSVYYDLTNGVSQSANKKDIFENHLMENKKKEICNSKFKGLPGNQFAYWVSKALLDDFTIGTKLGELASPRQGLATGDNEKFLRIWFEVNYNEIGFNFLSTEDFHETSYIYAPYNKGGEYRKWYGNRELVISFDKKNYELLSKQGNHLPSKQFYFSECATWSALTTSGFSCRYCEPGFVFDTKGSSCFCKKDKLYVYMGLLNSVVSDMILKMLSPTVDYNAGTVANVPVVIKNEKNVIELVKELIGYSKDDWDSFETSWDFERHPLISVISRNRMLFDNIDNIDLNECFVCWENECNERFEQLKKNEEELNRIFIDIYGLQDELTPEVEDKNVTVRKADLTRDIKSLISFAVGCMFGRYSLDENGLVYAGGKFDSSRYITFAADDDAIIPITDEEYFDDDIVTKFIEFIRIVYGNKSLESNLDFIAKALGNKGNTSREVIRNYFLNDFFKDHCSTYSVTGSGKRPIYWLFDSGKQSGFKCLIYIHRYNQDTVGLIRSMYFRKTQDAIENAMRNAEYVINTSSSAVERANATKKREKYIKQLNEMRPYYQAITHIALQRIDIDLDDGVKHNYQLFQGVEISGEGTKNQKIDLLAKI